VEYTFLYEEDDPAIVAVSPERKLFLAILSRAVLDIIGENRKHRRQAIAWIKGSPGQITFQQICELFDLSGDRLLKLEQYINQEAQVDIRFRIDPGKLPDTSI